MSVYEWAIINCNISTYLLPSLLGISVIIFLVGLFIKGKLSRYLIGIGLLSFIIIVFLLFGKSSEHCYPSKIAESHTKTSVHRIQESLMMYSVDHDGIFPDDISEISDEYLEQWPENAFTGELIRNIEFGSDPSQGDFTYLPVYSDNEITRFFLLAYGFDDEHNPGMDINNDGTGDNVILIISSEDEIDEELLQDLLI